MCGRLVVQPIEPVDQGIIPDDQHRPTFGRAGRLLVTWVDFDVTCRRCRDWIRIVRRA